jgi:hypothetical protein
VTIGYAPDDWAAWVAAARVPDQRA